MKLLAALILIATGCTPPVHAEMIDPHEKELVQVARFYCINGVLHKRFLDVISGPNEVKPVAQMTRMGPMPIPCELLPYKPYEGILPPVGGFKNGNDS